MCVWLCVCLYTYVTVEKRDLVVQIKKVFFLNASGRFNSLCSVKILKAKTLNARRDRRPNFLF